MWKVGNGTRRCNSTRPMDPNVEWLCGYGW